MNEVVLSTMISNIKSPLVFTVLVLSDVVENVRFCFMSSYLVNSHTSVLLYVITGILFVLTE